MTGILDNAEIEIPCKKCGRKTKKSVGWVKSHSEFTCSCGTRIILNTSKLRGEISKVDRAFADIKRTLEKLGK